MLNVAYDSLGRMITDANPLGTFTYAYERATQRLGSLSYPNGQTTTYAYFGNSGDHRLQEIHNKLSGGATLSKFTYAYDAVGNIATWSQQADANPAKTLTFGYDAADQLLTGARNPVDPSLVDRFAYAYDDAGNRTAEQLDDAVVKATYDNMNRLTNSDPGGQLRFKGTLNEAATVTVGGKPATVSAANEFEGRATVPSGTSNVEVKATDYSGNVRTNTYQVTQSGSSKTFTYDANGNLTSDGTRTYEWDVENRLSAITHPANKRTEFTYNGHHQRVRIVEKDNGVLTSDKRLLWCGLPKVCEERAPDGATVNKRFFEHGMAEGATMFFYVRDHLDSLREMTDHGGGLRARYDYNPYGRRTKLSGDKNADYGYTGHYNHDQSGLVLALYRAYDPTFGRWVSEDPIRFRLAAASLHPRPSALLGGYASDDSRGTNPFAYVSNRPLTLVDPLGLQYKCFCEQKLDECRWTNAGWGVLFSAPCVFGCLEIPIPWVQTVCLALCVGILVEEALRHLAICYDQYLKCKEGKGF